MGRRGWYTIGRGSKFSPRGGFNLPYRGGSVFNKGVQYTMDVNWPRVQNTIWHRYAFTLIYTTYQISLTYLERQKCSGPDKKILFKKQLFDLEVKVPRRSLRYATHRLMVMHPSIYHGCKLTPGSKYHMTPVCIYTDLYCSSLVIMSPLRMKGDILF
jgi:hypothetical protein